MCTALKKTSRYWFSHRAVIHLIDTNSPSRLAAAMRRGAAVLSVVLAIALLI
jgi:hypothetical protein